MAKATTKKPAQRKGASRNPRPAPRQGDGVPGWVWLLVGLAIGVFAAFLWHLQSTLKERNAPAAVETAPAPPAPARKAPANSAPAKVPGTGEEPRFDFYTLLPNQEVMPNSRPSTADAPRPVTRYLLQAGAFRQQAEADQRRAELLMLGMQVKIQPGTGKAGETLYRVVVGPFDGKESAEVARKGLQGSGVDTLLLKQ